MKAHSTERAPGILCIILAMLLWTSTGRSYEFAFSTYFGGSATEGIRDVEADDFGNVYVAGTTRSPDFPTTPGAYDEHVDTSLGTTRWGYNSEIFVAKFSPTGALVWSTVIGGPNSEEAYGLEIDSQGYVIVHGRGAAGSPVTLGVYQAQFKGCGGADPGNPHNTAQNAYICKLTPDGSTLVWGSFFGIDHLHRDLAIDDNDDLYVTWGVRPDKNAPAHWNTWMDSAWNANAFQPSPQGRDRLRRRQDRLRRQSSTLGHLSGRLRLRLHRSLYRRRSPGLRLCRTPEPVTGHPNDTRRPRPNPQRWRRLVRRQTSSRWIGHRLRNLYWR